MGALREWRPSFLESCPIPPRFGKPSPIGFDSFTFLCCGCGGVLSARRNASSRRRATSSSFSCCSGSRPMAREPPNPELLHELYIDESSQTKHRYLVLGGLIIPRSLLDEFERKIREARLPELPSSEMKWSKVSQAKLPAYKRVTEAFLFPSPTLRQVEFHSLVVDTTKLRDNVFNAGSREVGFNKEIYQLCQKFGRIRRNGIFHVYLDNRETKFTTQKLRDILNLGIMAKQPSRDWPYRRVHFRNSADCLSLQVVDILLGSIAFHINGHRSNKDASKAKSHLSDFVLQAAGVRDVRRDTSVRGRFTIWHRQLK